MTEPVPLKPEKPSDTAEKALRKREAERGPLDPADRYRALVNAVKAAQELIELGDKKARFALVIMSVLNAVIVLLVVRGGEAIIPSSGLLGTIIRLELVAYAVVTVYYLSQAIAALRPRGVRPPPTEELPSSIEPGQSMRVLFYADVISRERAAFRGLWDGLRMDNLTTELVDQLYALSWINHQKFTALDRLYFGLTVMTVMLAVLLGTIALHHVGG